MLENIITPEDIEFLKGLARELKTQDTACTAKPVYFTIMQEDKEWGIHDDYVDGYAICDDEGNSFEELDEFIEWIVSCHFDEDDEEDAEKIAELKAITDLEEAYEWVNENGIDSLNYVGYRNTEKHSEMFLTRSALQEHLRLNYYHYKNNPVSYAQHAWRNPQLERLLKIIEKFDTETVSTND